MQTRTTDGRRSRRTRRRSLASFFSLLLVFSFTLGQAGTLMAFADEALGDDPAVLVEEGDPAITDESAVDPAGDSDVAEPDPALEGDPEVTDDSDDAGVQASASGGSSSTPKDESSTQAELVPQAAALTAGAISLDLVAAGPGTYDHATGIGGTYGNRTISKNNGVVESLEGGDFACGDLVVYFTAITADADAGSGSVDLDFLWDGQTTSGSPVGFNDLVSASISTNPPDVGNTGSGDETVQVLSEQFTSNGNRKLEATIRVAGIDGGERVILRTVVRLYCDPTTKITGNIHAAIVGAEVTNGARINTGNQTVPLKQAGNILVPGLNVTKSCPETATVGQTITYEITVSNTGQDTLNDLVVSDPLLGGTLGSFPTTLAPDASVTRSFTYQLGASPDPLTNTVTATASAQSSTATVSDTADCTVDVLFPDLAIDKTANPAGPVSAGDQIGFDITVSNDGEGTAFDVTLTDTLPTNAGLSWNIDSTSGGWSCAINAGVLTCGGQGFDLAAGASASVRVISPTTTASCALIQNTATVGASNHANVQDSASVTVDCADIDVEKTADEDTVDAAEQIGFTIVVTNDGDGTARDVTMTDTLPTNAGLDWSIEATSGGWSCAINAGVLTCGGQDFDLASGASASVHVVSPTDATTCGEVDNVANVTTSNDGSDQDGATIVVNCPDLGIGIDKQGPSLAHVGDAITYTFDVSLTTPEPLFDVVVSDPLCDSQPALVGKAGGNQDDVLEPGEVWSYECTHVVTDQDPDPLPNTATAQGTADDGRTTTDQDDHVVDLIHPAIRIVKTVDPASGEPGDVVTYTYEVTNTGDTTLYDVTVDDDVLGHIGDIAVLQVGQTVVLTQDFVLPNDVSVVVNVAIAIGEDELGEEVSDDDDASVTIVLAETPTPPPSNPPTAFTGADSGRMAMVAGALLALGLIASAAGRRRRHPLEG